MSVNIVLPTLSLWAASHLTGILEAKTQKDFDDAFDTTFATHCSITVNGKPVSRDAYKALLLQQSAADPLENGTAVNIEGQTEVEVGNQGQLSGLVGIFYTALSDSKYLVLGVPAESKATSSLNLVIEPTEKRPPENPHLHIRGYFDPRRVVTVNQVVAESTYHVTIPAASVPPVTVPSGSSKVELGPGPVKLPPNHGSKQKGPFGGHFGPGPVRLPPSETGATPETLPGYGAFGVGPVIVPGETLGDAKA